MDTSRQLPTHGDGPLDMRKLARTLLESMANEVMDAQADMPCGDGANARNGYRERGLATPVGDITPRMPRLRAGAYFPEGVIERCSRADRAVAAAVARAEGFFGTLKCDLFEGRDRTGGGFDEFAAALDEYIEWYRGGKLKKSLGWRTIRQSREELAAA